MATTPGNREIGFGAFLVVLILLYVVFDLECGLLLGCFLPLPVILVGFDAIFVALVVLMLGIMLMGAGAMRRARARLPSYIV
jgi:hypothetical protein